MQRIKIRSWLFQTVSKCTKKLPCLQLEYYLRIYYNKFPILRCSVIGKYSLKIFLEKWFRPDINI